MDGSELAELALTLAVWMSTLTGAGLDLARVIRPITADYEYSMSYLPDPLTEIEDAGRVYLAGVAAKLQPQTYLTVGTRRRPPWAVERPSR